MRKYLRLTEYVWLTLAILCAGMSAFLVFKGYNDESGVAMMVTALAAVMYLMRRRFNRILKRAEEEENASHSDKA